MTPEQAALLRKARASLGAARLLAEQEDYFDFAVSRTYYTMFYIAEAMLLGEELAFSKHSAVIAAFGEIFAKTDRVPPKFHRYLIEGEDIRNIGDYDIKSGVTGDKVREQVVRAEKFLELAVRVIGPIPDQVKEE